MISSTAAAILIDPRIVFRASARDVVAASLAGRARAASFLSLKTASRSICLSLLSSAGAAARRSRSMFVAAARESPRYRDKAGLGIAGCSENRDCAPEGRLAKLPATDSPKEFLRRDRAPTIDPIAANRQDLPCPNFGTTGSRRVVSTSPTLRGSWVNGRLPA